MASTNKITKADMVWMAAAIEFRGRVKRYSGNTQRATTQLVLYLHSRQLNCVRRMCELTGVGIRTAPTKKIEPGVRRGCAEHCPQPHVHTAVDVPEMGIWAMTGSAAGVVLHNLMPFMYDNVDELQAFVDDAIAQLPAGPHGRHAVALSLRRLRKLGWAFPAEMQTWLDEHDARDSELIRRMIDNAATVPA